MHGGGVLAESCAPDLINNTITQNQADPFFPDARGGGIRANPGAMFVGANNIIYNNTGFGDPEYSGNVNLNYSCCSVVLSGTGNITNNPRFVDPATDDFNLQSSSPCIDTGDPLSPNDPDGTRADMGALYFDQTAYPSWTINAWLNGGSPVPPGGGNLLWGVYAENTSGQVLNGDIWVAFEYEGGLPTILLSRALVNYQPGWAVNRPDNWYPVPPDWPGGNYMWYVRTGDLDPYVVWEEGGFAWFKDGVADGGYDFTNNLPTSGYSDPFDEIISGTAELFVPESFEVIGAYPNPFNPSTVISYHLPDASLVHMMVYDLSGRKVADLVNGWRDAGVHEVTFDGSGLASGLYIYRLTTGDHTASGKMILVK
ncbi:hypothetical protein CEE37_07585 [candidate division LCP-89 bacterium B3_LCP]|uniref:Secretion system C-terminal sorting domain-containing protein n=1 Tax=candidate division LCP-89 bacterium B3_LCP TaxID=2012998 RepID=A0A532V1H1_UNCL8|nr:MAG: hypothetical protein CEE37_07585 [candidate division LCP-89 bacterium B3_LCP]